MPDFAAAIRDFFETATVLEAALAGIAMLSLLTAIVGWFLRMNRRDDRPLARGRAAGAGRRSAVERGAHWVPDAGLVFSASDDDDFQHRPIDPRDLDGDGNGDDDDDREPIFDGVADASGGAARAVEAVRERPLEFLASAIATGFAAGLIVPLFANQNRTVQLLERLAKLHEENRSQAQREADRFRSARNG
jgi:hypothetical protein